MVRMGDLLILKGKLLGNRQRPKLRVDWSIGSTTVVLDHGQCILEAQQECSSAVRNNDSPLALQTSRNDMEDWEEIQEPSDNEKKSEMPSSQIISVSLHERDT